MQDKDEVLEAFCRESKLNLFCIRIVHFTQGVGGKFKDVLIFDCFFLKKMILYT